MSERLFHCWQCGKPHPCKQVCAKCACAVYCSGACQRAAWTSVHKQHCGQLRSQRNLVAEVTEGSGHKLHVDSRGIVATVSFDPGTVLFEGPAFLCTEDDMLCRDLHSGVETEAARATAWHRYLTLQDTMPEALQDMVRTVPWHMAALLTDDQPTTAPGVLCYFGLAVGRDPTAVNAEWEVIKESVRVPPPPPHAGRLQTDDRPVPPLQICTVRVTATQAIARGCPLCVRPKPAPVYK
jgi:hypothetical protein